MTQLVGASEIAKRLGAGSTQTVHAWRRRGTDGFPLPVLELDMGHLWYWPDVERWARKTGRLG